MTTYSEVLNPHYADSTGNAIFLDVKFDNFPNSVRFVATKFDPEIYGVELYNKAVAGDFGQIAAFVPSSNAEAVQSGLTEKQFTDAAQALLNFMAKSKGFDNMLSAASYVGYPNAFQATALKLVTWRANVWVFAEALLAEVKAGTKPAPATIQEFLDMLPKFVE